MSKRSNAVPSTFSPLENRLLARLPDAEWQRLLPRLQTVPLEFKKILYEPGSPMKYVYFPNAGMISVVNLMDEGIGIEVATIGNEGAGGLLDVGGAAADELDEAIGAEAAG